VIVVNAGGARFLEGDPITMMPQDVIHVCKAAPHAQVIAVHMEAINHCLLTRGELAKAARPHCSVFAGFWRTSLRNGVCKGNRSCRFANPTEGLLS